MKVQDEIRKVFKWIERKSVCPDKWGNNASYTLSGKKYIVGKMSYDEWYIEPYRQGRKETDKFHKDTLWEKGDTIQVIQLFVDNGLMSIKAS